MVMLGSRLWRSCQSARRGQRTWVSLLWGKGEGDKMGQGQRLEEGRSEMRLEGGYGGKSAVYSGVSCVLWWQGVEAVGQQLQV